MAGMATGRPVSQVNLVRLLEQLPTRHNRREDGILRQLRRITRLRDGVATTVTLHFSLL